MPLCEANAIPTNTSKEESCYVHKVILHPSHSTHSTADLKEIKRGEGPRETEGHSQLVT